MFLKGCPYSLRNRTFRRKGPVRLQNDVTPNFWNALSPIEFGKLHVGMSWLYGEKFGGRYGQPLSFFVVVLFVSRREANCCCQAENLYVHILTFWKLPPYMIALQRHTKAPKVADIQATRFELVYLLLLMLLHLNPEKQQFWTYELSNRQRR